MDCLIGEHTHKTLSTSLHSLQCNSR